MKTENKLLIKVGLAVFLFSTLAAYVYRPRIEEEEIEFIKPEKYIYSPINYSLTDTLFEKELKKFIEMEQPVATQKEHMVFVEMSRKKCKLYYTYDAFNIAERSNVFFFKFGDKIMAASNIANDDITISKEYVWSILKDIFPSQHRQYQQDIKMTADTITANVWYLTFDYIRNSVKREVKQEKIR